MSFPDPSPSPIHPAVGVMSDATMTRPSSPGEGLVVKSLEDVNEPIDFRIRNSSRPSAEQLDEGFTRQISDLVHGGHHHHPDTEKQTPPDDEPLYVRISFLRTSWVLIRFIFIL